MDKATKAEFLGCFRFDPPQSKEDAKQAADRHEELQKKIREALEEDKRRPKTDSAGPAAQSASKKRGAAHGSADGGETPDAKRHASCASD